VSRGNVTITKHNGTNCMIAICSGTLNLFNAKQIRAELEPLLSQEKLRVILDLEGLISIDSSGIGALVNFVLATRKHLNAMAIVVGPQEAVMRIFEITKLKSFFTIVNTIEEAVDLFD